MNSCILTISGVLFLLTCGLSMPKCGMKTRINKLSIIIDNLKEDVACDNNTALFVLPLESTNCSETAKYFQNELETIESKCTVKKPITVHHVKGILEKIRDKKDAKCIFKTNETVSYKSFLDKFKNLVEQYNSSLDNCTTS